MHTLASCFFDFYVEHSDHHHSLLLVAYLSFLLAKASGAYVCWHQQTLIKLINSINSINNIVRSFIAAIAAAAAAAPAALTRYE